VSPGCDALAATQTAIRIPPFIPRREHRTSGQWPLCDFLEFGALVTAVPCARLHARLVLREWELPGLSESAELVVSELVSNAVRASRAVPLATPVRLWLLSDRAQVQVVVWDANPQPPVRAGASAESENGRGLMLVEAFSQQWGWYPDSCSREAVAGAKFVWAVIR
jgi:anti-sigma regulatory factor (Ser/Thr protein kinase)